MKFRKPIEVDNSFEIKGLRNRFYLIKTALFRKRLFISADLTELNEEIVERIVKNRKYKTK